MSGLSRRSFLQAAVASSALGVAVPRWAMAAGAAPLATDEGMLVVVTLTGGVDPLEVLVPSAGDRRAAYAAARGAIAVDPASLHPATADHGFAPGLPLLAARYGAGQVALVDGVGMPENLRSHFVSEAVTRSATPEAGSTGWLGRHLDGFLEAVDELAAVAVTPTIPLHMQGVTSRCATLPRDVELWGDETARFERTAHDAVRAFADVPNGRGRWADAIAANGAYALDKATLAGGLVSSTSGTGLFRDLEFAAHVLNADVGTRVVAVETWGYDTHASQRSTVSELFGQLDAAIDHFWATLTTDRHHRVMVLVVSEFGRKLHVNSGLGTDHGHAGMAMLIGPNVVGGLHGEPPSLTAPDDTDSLVPTTDLRAVYASVIDDWLAGDSTESLGGPYSGLGLIAAPPGTVP